MVWYRFSEGGLLPIDTPSWAWDLDDNEDLADLLIHNGLSAVGEVKGGYGCFVVKIYRYPSRSDPFGGLRWLFLLGDPSPTWPVLVEGFPRYLEFLRHLGPILTAGQIMLLGD